MQHYDVVIIGAGAAGLMCAASAGYRGRSVLVLDHANKAGKKILMSGGGRCNFTNLNTTPDHFVSANPHFCKSAGNTPAMPARSGSQIHAAPIHINESPTKRSTIPSSYDVR